MFVDLCILTLQQRFTLLLHQYKYGLKNTELNTFIIDSLVELWYRFNGTALGCIMYHPDIDSITYYSSCTSDAQNTVSIYKLLTYVLNCEYSMSYFVYANSSFASFEKQLMSYV